MEALSRVVLFVVLFSASTASIEPRKVLKIPEKIIGGVIEMVQNHKNKPTQGYQSQSQVQVQGTQPYPTWSPTNQYQSQAQFQGQSQYTNYGNYVAPAVTYPPTAPTYPIQGNYGSQTQGQHQSFGQQSGGQLQTQNQNYNGLTQSQFQGQQNFQGQGQQNFQGQGQQNFQGQGQQNYQGQHQLQTQNQYGMTQPTAVQGQNQNQYVGHNQNQMQTGQYGQNAGQNYQPPQFTGQNYNQGQFSGQTTHFQGSSPAQVPQGLPNGNGQSGSFQGSGTPIGGGPSCVCQAWTKDPLNVGGAGKSEEITEKNAINTDA